MSQIKFWLLHLIPNGAEMHNDIADIIQTLTQGCFETTAFQLNGESFSSTFSVSGAEIDIGKDGFLAPKS
ncbi:hypothetical protein SH139x_003721 [Planctomycetaceae bacterium SH139]